MRQNNFELRLLVGGKPIHEYEHQGNYFVEGRKNSEFELEFKNNTGGRVLAVPSVDGLSVMDGKPATADSMGYIVGPNSSLRIPGWRLDSNGIAKFVFNDKEASYARQTGTHDARNAGVIGILVYEEKVKVATLPRPYVPVPVRPYQPHVPAQPYIPVQPWQPFWNGYVGGTLSPASPFDVMRGIHTHDAVNNSAANAASVVGGQAASGSSASQMSFSAGTTKHAAPKTKSRRVRLDEKPGQFEMGTGFGDKADFRTHEVQFDRGNQVAALVIYYDSRRNLEKRGIQVLRKSRTYLEDLPSPFQGTGCAPPNNWQD